MNLSVVIIALNEEKNIGDCLKSASWAGELIVLDSGSRDRTREVAAAAGARIFESPFRDFSSQKNKALEYATRDWVLLLDADERVTPELQKEVQSVIQNGEKCVYEIGRATFHFGRRLRFSGTQQDYPIRLWPRNTVAYEQPVHERIVTQLPVRRLKRKLLHFTTRDMEEYKRKLESYVSFEIKMMQGKERKPSWPAMIWRPPARFLHRYVIQLGFLDGGAGFLFSYLAGYYEYVKYRRYFDATKKV